MSGEHAPRNLPESFGAELRRLRESAGLSLEDIIAETKISRRILDALEEGRFAYLPERVFSSNFVRQYARLIRADENLLARQFDAAWEQFLTASGTYPKAQVELERPPAAPIRWRFWLPIALGAAILLGAAVMIFRVRGEDLGVRPDPRRARVVQPAAAGRPGVAPSPTVAAVTPAPATAPGEAVDPEQVRFRVEVDPSSECWVHYRDRDGRTEQHLLGSGGRLDLALPGPVLLTLGNAGEVTIEVGERVYEELGRPGEVVHTELSRGGLKVLGPGGGIGQ
jgi:cytoskeletal protein RodZ